MTERYWLKPTVLGGDGPRIVGYCVVADCGIPMISEWAWDKMSPEQRPAGVGKHEGHGLCGVHHHRLRRNGHTDYVGPRKSNVTGPDQAPVTQCSKCSETMVLQRYRSLWPELADKHRALGGQGLCKTCYRRAREAGELERTMRSSEDTLEDWAFMRDDGITLEAAAARLGMSVSALDKALYRARKKGDPRGSLTPFAHDMRRAS